MEAKEKEIDDLKAQADYEKNKRKHLEDMFQNLSERENKLQMALEENKGQTEKVFLKSLSEKSFFPAKRIPLTNSSNWALKKLHLKRLRLKRLCLKKLRLKRLCLKRLCLKKLRLKVSLGRDNVITWIGKLSCLHATSLQMRADYFKFCFYG